MNRSSSGYLRTNTDIASDSEDDMHHNPLIIPIVKVCKEKQRDGNYFITMDEPSYVDSNDRLKENDSKFSRKELLPELST